MKKVATGIGLVVALGLGLVSSVLAGLDIGLDEQNLLDAKSQPLFGVGKPIATSSTASVSQVTADANPLTLATFANGLSARVVTAAANAGPNIDMMALWPNDTDPTWLIACNEQGAAQPALQRIRISDGLVETIVSGGLVSCDPAHRTPWGTVVFAEENGSSGRLFELVDPLHTTGVTIDGSGNPVGGTGTSNIARRDAVGKLSFEGVGITASGVMYYGDENRPLNGTAGGAYFKFIPTTLWDPQDPPITDLDDSPLVGGSIFGLRLGKRSSNTDYGQGTQTGLGTWIPVPGGAPVDLRAAASTLKLTGYYRPEDLDFDLVALGDGNVRWCGNNTGNELTDRNYGETICLTDGTIAQAANATTLSTPEVQFLVIGYPDFAMMDNIAYQPGRGNWIVHEDGDGPEFPIATRHNNDLWDCLPDGADANLLSDGCIRIGTLNDLHVTAEGNGAEWTGGVFDATGTRLFVSVQHNVTGHGLILEVIGWK